MSCFLLLSRKNLGHLFPWRCRGLILNKNFAAIPAANFFNDTFGSSIITLSAYEACLQNAAYYIHTLPGFLQVSGEDRLAFLQRQTTNDLHLLLPGHTLSTVLTSPTARILDIFTVWEEVLPNSSPVLNLISLPGQSEKTEHYLRSRIFFMDKVGLTNLSSLYKQIDLMGLQAFDALRMLSVKAAPELNQVISTYQAGLHFSFFAQRGILGAGYRLWIESSAVGSLTRTLEASGIPALPPDSYRILCVEAGIPQPSAELTDAFTPLEIGLTNSISMNKGCYTGQEIIARQVNFDKVTRHLVGLSLDAQGLAGDTVFADDKPVGLITSCVLSPHFGPIALTVIRRPYNEPGTPVVVGQAASSVHATVTPLPFLSS